MQRPEIVKGGVDDLNRPFVKLTAKGFLDPLTAFIDTGFNGSMILDEDQAERMGLHITRNYPIAAILASQQAETFFLCRGRIGWLGEEPFISAFVIRETAAQRIERRRRKREEEIVLGVELLLNCSLEIDFTDSQSVAEFGFAPVPCNEDKFNVDKMPTDIVEVYVSIADGPTLAGGSFDGRGDVGFDLEP